MFFLIKKILFFMFILMLNFKYFFNGSNSYKLYFFMCFFIHKNQ